MRKEGETKMAVKLSNVILEKFIGGQAMIYYQEQPYMVGRIKQIEIVPGSQVPKVTFNLLAASLNGKWVIIRPVWQFEDNLLDVKIETGDYTLGTYPIKLQWPGVSLQRLVIAPPGCDLIYFSAVEGYNGG